MRMRFDNLPSIRGTGNIAKAARAEHYSNPPGFPGLRGFMLDKKGGARIVDQDANTGTAYSMARKGEPMR